MPSFISLDRPMDSRRRGPTTDAAWEKPRRVAVLVDNDSWILPYAIRLVDGIEREGDVCRLVRRVDDLPEGDVAFLLGCVHIVPSRMLKRHRFNLVVHESDLPKGRGFSPMTWQILEGATRVPVCLFVASDGVDAGPVVYRDTIGLSGNETYEEWRHRQGEKTLELCRRFLDEQTLPAGMEQRGEPTSYPRRRPCDSRLDPNRTIAEQFDLLRVADPERYPAYFHYRKRRFMLILRPDDRPES